MAAVRQGSESRHCELEQVYREHFSFVWRSLRRLGVPENDLPDVTQDVFLIVARKLETFDHCAKITTWLYGVCLRQASELRRRAHVRREVPAGVEPVDSYSSPAAAVDLHQKRRLLEAALSSMPLEQRAVFVLFELDGCTGEQIAELMQTPVATVHSRLRLARTAFRRYLERVERRDGSALRRFGVSP